MPTNRAIEVPKHTPYKKYTPSIERVECLQSINQEENQRNQNFQWPEDEIAQYADNDPATFEAMKNTIDVAHSATIRWTDNVFTLQQWCSKNFTQAKEQLDNLYNQVGITDDFDYVELPAAIQICSIRDQMPEVDI